MAGGLEKNIVLLANHLAGKGMDVILVSFDYPGAEAFYDLDSRIRWHKVGVSRPHSSISFSQRIQLIREIRGILRKLAVPTIICFHHGIIFRFLMASFLLKSKLICSERNSLSLYKYIRQSKWTLNFLLLAFADKITVQFPNYVREYPFWLRKKITVIPNPVFESNKLAQPDVPNKDNRYTLITVGRLCAQKNQAGLIDAFSILADKYPDWDLYIVGDGGHYDILNKKIHECNLIDRIFLTGKSNDVPSWLSRSHLFCLPSQWEGFPNALAEAMAQGLPSVGLITCAGVRDLIEDNVSGLLANPSQLTQSLEKLMSSAAMRKEMGKAAVLAMSQYAPETTFTRWDYVLSEI